jgi:hypothetical protein
LDRVRHEQEGREDYPFTTPKCLSCGTRADSTALLASRVHFQFEEAHAWGTLGLDLVEKHYAHSRFADRGEVWEIFYCTA